MHQFFFNPAIGTPRFFDAGVPHDDHVGRHRAEVLARRRRARRGS